MCGFVAIAGANAAAPHVVERGLAAIRHRGPDGEGTWRSPRGDAALGHARLAILDLSDSGAQPMRSADGRATIAYNGEVYNFRDLARRIDAPLRSRSDTEVILELLRRHGTGALPSLRGMFAFAYWDGDELLLVRDRLGIKPLFWAEDGCARLVAASEIGAVLAMRAARPAIDGRAIDDYLTYLYVPPPRTGIAGVHELPPAHWLRWRPGGAPRVERWWTVPSRAPRQNARPEAVRAILEDSVRVHLESDVPVGVFLSGGLDSSSIVSFAARHYPATLSTFNVTFGDEGKALDERSFARKVASRFGTKHHEIRVTADVARILPEMAARFGQPFGNPTAVLAYALSRATREHVKVALAGDGGDEMLGGYPRYQGVRVAEIVRRAPPWLASATLGLVQRMAPPSAARGRPLDRLHRFLTASERPLDEMYFRWVSYFDVDRKTKLLADRAALLGQDAADREYEFFASIRARHARLTTRDVAPLVDIESFLPHNVLAYGDRMSMAHALEVRVPYCDHLVAEALAPLPSEAKMPGGLQKGLFHWAMLGHLPRKVIAHRKVGFNPPIAAWLRNDLAPILEEYLSERSVRERGLFAPRAVADLRREFVGGRGEIAHNLWALLVIEQWARWLG